MKIELLMFNRMSDCQLVDWPLSLDVIIILA